METAQSPWVTSSILSYPRGEKVSPYIKSAPFLFQLVCCLLHAYCVFVPLELHWVLPCLLLQPLQVPLDGSPAFKLSNGSTTS